MNRTTTVVLGTVGALALVAGGFAAGHAYGTRADADPLPTAHVTLAPASVELPVRVESPGGACPAFAFPAPDAAVTGDPADAQGFRLGDHASVVVTCVGTEQEVDGIAGLISAKVTDPASSGVVEAPVLVDGPMGQALRVEQRHSHQDLTEWYLVHDGWVVALGYLRATDAARPGDLAIVDSVLAGWQWL